VCKAITNDQFKANMLGYKFEVIVVISTEAQIIGYYGVLTKI
jgi:hypothetical protein